MRKLIFAAAVLFSFSAFAADKPSELAKAIKSDIPLGHGACTRLWIKAYDAYLWTDASVWSMDAPFALSLKYDMDFGTDDLADKSIEEMQRIQPLSKEAAENYSKQLYTLFPNVHKGDVITALYVPGKGTTFYHNGKSTGKITDDTFSRRFFDIWLSDKTSEPKLRLALLNQQ